MVFKETPKMAVPSGDTWSEIKPDAHIHKFVWGEDTNGLTGQYAAKMGKAGEDLYALLEQLRTLDREGVGKFWRGAAADEFMKLLREKAIPALEKATFMHQGLQPVLAGWARDMKTIQDDVHTALKKGFAAYQDYTTTQAAMRAPSTPSTNPTGQPTTAPTPQSGSSPQPGQAKATPHPSPGQGNQLASDLGNATTRMNEATRDLKYNMDRRDAAADSWLKHVDEAIQGKVSSVGSVRYTK